MLHPEYLLARDACLVLAEGVHTYDGEASGLPRAAFVAVMPNASRAERMSAIRLLLAKALAAARGAVKPIRKSLRMAHPASATTLGGITADCWAGVVIEAAESIQRREALGLEFPCFTAGEHQHLDIGLRMEFERASEAAEQKYAGVGTKSGKQAAENLAESNRHDQKLPVLARALGVLVQNPGWTVERIAESVGTSREYLSSLHKFKAARKAIKEAGKANVPHGAKSADGDLEAWDED